MKKGKKEKRKLIIELVSTNSLVDFLIRELSAIFHP